MDTSWKIEGSHCRFENGVVSGYLLTSGEYQGMRSLVHRPTGIEIAAGEKLPGLVAPYRVFGNAQRYGDVRDRQPQVELVPEGAKLTHEADTRNPFDLESVYSWRGDTLDIGYTLTPRVKMRGFEIGIASYLAAGFRAFAFLQSNNWGESACRLVPVDANPMTDAYALFPRSEAEMKTIFDGRWNLPPYPVRYAVPGYFAQPMAFRHHAPSGVTALGMADPQECYALCIPVNNPAEHPDPAHGYQALYFYFFGRDLAEGDPVQWRLRWVIGHNLTRDDMEAHWKKFA